MTQTNRIEVEFSPKLTDPSLLAALVEATRYFDEEHSTLPNNTEWFNAKLKWVPSPNLPGFVRPIFQEEHKEYEAHVHFVDIPISQMLDDYGRNSNMRKLLRRVIRARSTVSSKRIDRWILEIEAEEGSRGD